VIILDTNVLSEVQKPNPNKQVMAWLDAQEPGDLHVTAITAEELLFGALIVPVGDRRARLVGAIEAMLQDDFNARVLPYDVTASQVSCVAGFGGTRTQHYDWTCRWSDRSDCRGPESSEDRDP
jgi:predicted nucleic acid-binding protein